MAGRICIRNTNYQIFTVKILSEKAWEYDVKIQHIFIDFQSAYDCIRRDKLYETINFFAIPNKLTKLIKTTMKDST
jgi:hypothetical protein